MQQSVDLNLLTALDALLQAGSVRGAAAAVGLSPSAMSRALSRLREATGDPLLVLAGRKMVPTPHALALRDRVHALAAEANAVLSVPAAATAEPARFSRRFVVRADDAVAAVLGPALLAAIRQEAPGVSVRFVSEGSESVDALREGLVDLDIGVQGPLAPEICTRLLLRQRRVVVVRDGLAGLPEGGWVSLAALAALEHVVVSRRGRDRGPLDELLASAGLQRRVRAIVPTQLAAAALVARSDAASLLSASVAAALRETMGLRVLSLDAALPEERVELAWHPRFSEDPAHAWLRQTCAAIGQGQSRRV